MDLTQPFSFFGSGDVLVDPLTSAGVQTGLQLKGECPDVSVKIDGDIEEQTGSGRDNFGQVVGSVSIPKPGAASFTFTQADIEMFAMVFYGTGAVMTQSSGTGVAVTLDVKPGRWVEMGKFRTSNEVVKNIAGDVTYVLGTDYEINARLGLIKFVAGSALAGEAQAAITLDHAAVTGATIQGMTKSNIRIRLVVDGVDLDSGRDFMLVVHQLRLKPSGDVTIKGKKFIEAKFEGTMETPAGKTSPFDLTFFDPE